MAKQHLRKGYEAKRRRQRTAALRNLLRGIATAALAKSMEGAKFQVTTG